MQTILFILFGYLSGSVLYARIFARMFGKKDMLENSRDKNPGTANAFISVYDSNGYLQQDIHIKHYSGTVTIYSNNKINGNVCIIKA